MALLDLQDLELPEVSGHPPMASNSNSHGSGGILDILSLLG
jgi:hypothetical protein